MRILVLAPIVPDSPSDGDRLRLFHFLRELSKRHELTLACFGAVPNGLGELKSMLKALHVVPISRSQRMIHAGLNFFSAEPWNTSSMKSGAMRRLVQRLLGEGQFDALYCYRLSMAPYALRARLPRVLDYTDSLTRYFERRASRAVGFRRWLYRREARRIAAYEQFCAWQFDACLMNSEADTQTLRAMAPGANVVTASNGVDFGALKPGKLKRDPDQLAFIGFMAYPPNIEAVLWFARDILPRIQAHRTKARLLVVGGGTAAALDELKGRSDIKFTGYVADFAPYLHASGLSVCPVQLAAGRQNKILDAFATGTPVVATSLTAAGVEARAGSELLVADSPDDFAAACLRLMGRPAEGRRLAANALRFVKKNYQWSAAARSIEDSFKELP